MALSGELKQATAVTLKIGPFVDSGDGNTVEGLLTISQADVRLSKNGGNFAQKNESTACTHDELGYYDCPLDTTDTNTVGILTVAVHEAGALPVRHDYIVVPAVEYREVVRRNTAQAGAASTITLDASASATDSIYVGMVVYIASGTGAGQYRVITGYVGSTKVATIEPDWTTNPDNTSVFEIVGTPPGAGVETAVTSAMTDFDVATAGDVSTAESSIPGAVWDEVPAEPAAAATWASTFGEWFAYVGARLRNKSTFTKSTGAWTLRNDADDADLATRTDSNDATTYVKGEES